MMKQSTPQAYPFRCVLSFKPLIDSCEKNKASWGEMGVSYLEKLKAKLDEVPELCGPIEDLSLIRRHEELVKGLVSLVLPPTSWESDLVGIFVPFNLQPVYVSPPFRRLLLDEAGHIKGIALVGEEMFLKGRILRAYYLIIEKYYGIGQKFEYPIVRVVSDPKTGLDLHLRIKPNLQFLEIHHKGELKELSEKERAVLLEHLAEPEVLREILPPENFEIHGLSVFNIIDVTQSEMLSALGKDLIDQESIYSQAGFMRLQQRIRTLFRCPELVISLVAIHEDQVMLINLGCELSSSSVFSGSRHIPLSEFQGSLYEQAVTENRVLRIRDLSAETPRSRAEKEMIKGGVRSLMIAPLTYEGALIGTLDIASPQPEEFGPIDIMLLAEIAPIFSMAVKRALEEIDHSLQEIIKEKCTAIHPAVEWRFRKAAYQHLNRLRMGQDSEMEPIVFRDVYPLYGVSDVRGSSVARNRAIAEDLEEHLNLALAVTEAAGRLRPLAVLEELGHRLRREVERIRIGISPADESAIAHLLKREVEALFPHLRTFGPEVVRAVDAYEMLVDERLGTVYRRRKEFEDSVSLLNQRISFYLDREEGEAQAIYPHYFEKHQTDGVDYLIYLGAALNQDGSFSDLYLENFRLWQLMVACGIAWITEQLKGELKVPLETAHLILASHTTLSIRFRFEEKRFDVDGAYDVRHEIIKSRLDKAMVKGRPERLTQPGVIAVVFSQPHEGREVRRHMEFLVSKGYLKGDVESLDVEELPGVQGLRAMRGNVDLDSPAVAERVTGRIRPLPHAEASTTNQGRK
ncbi:MAG: GAF domain-containing protein [Desulfatiglandaceae bacterium]